jgi:hypothetical protein
MRRSVGSGGGGPARVVGVGGALLLALLVPLGLWVLGGFVAPEAAWSPAFGDTSDREASADMAAPPDGVRQDGVSPPSPRDGAGAESSRHQPSVEHPERALPVEQEAAATALRLWIPGGFDPDILDAAVDLPEVVSATISRSDTVGLLAARTARGDEVAAFADGFRVPVTVTAIDPQVMASQAAGQAASAIASLVPGQALLTETAAQLRGIDAGGEIDLVGRAGLTVAAIVPDGTLRRSEIAVHSDEAAAIGLPDGGAITIVHEAAPGEATDQLVAALGALAPEGVEPRVSGRSDDGARRSPLVLSLPELKATFGEFAYRPRSGVREIDIDPSFVDENIVTAPVPVLGNVQCHRAIIDDVRAALQELVDAGLAGWIDPAQYGGCFYARHIGVDRNRLSSHSWGAAIDINVDLSMPGLGPVPPDEMIEIFGRHGFRWGGDFTTPDHHHWEWVGESATDRRDR